MAYTYDMNLLGDNIDTIKENTETLIDTSEKVLLEINVKKLNKCCSFITRIKVKIVA
jgi:hypothetical protein